MGNLSVHLACLLAQRHGAACTITAHGVSMPTLTRMIISLALLAAALYGIMFALANGIAPRQSEITVDVPLPETGPITPRQPPDTPAGSTGQP